MSSTSVFIDAKSSIRKECNLLLVEGVSAATFVEANLEIIGNEKFGVFTTGGLLANVSASPSKASTDQVLQKLMKAANLNFCFNYDSKEERDSLRFGKFLLFSDGDDSGFYQNCLLLNFFFYFFPVLIDHQWVVIVKPPAECSLASIPTATGRSFFTTIHQHFVTVQEGPNAAAALARAFGFKEKEVEERQQWINSALQVFPGSTAHAALSSMSTITIECLINELLILALTAQVRQKVPRFCDTLRTGERMIVSTMLNRSKDVYLRGDELCGKVSSNNNYRHNHLSLYETVVRMAKTAAGCGHCPLLKSRGDLGGKSAPPPQSHYTAFKRSPVANLLVTITSADLLLPILPLALLNGSEGATHGVRFSFPMFSPRDVASAVMQSLRGEPVQELIPKWNGIISHVSRRSPLEYQFHDDTGEKLLSGSQRNKKAFVASLKVISQNGALLTFTTVEEFVVKWTDERLQQAVVATGKDEVAVKEQWTTEILDFLHWYQSQSTTVEKRHNKRQCTADLRQVLSSSPEANVKSPATAATAAAAAAAPMEVADVEGGDESEAPPELIDQGSSMFSPSVASQYTSPPEVGEANQFEQDGDWGEDDGEIADLNLFDDDSPASPSPPSLPEQQHQQPANPFISASSVFASSSVPITTDCPGARCHFREHPLPQDEHIFRFHTMLRTYACLKCSYKGKKWSTVKEHLKGKKTHNIKFKHHLYIIDLMTTPDWEQEKERQLAEETAV